MKGSLKTVRTQDHPHNRTNFNDWCDPKCKPLRRKIHKSESFNDEFNKLCPEQVQNASISSRTSIEIEELRKKIKDGYPLLSLKEIRRVKLPFYESLLLNLKEDGFLSTCEFIKDLIVLDEEWHKERFKDPILKDRPFLKSDKFALTSICNGLTKAEIAKKEGNKNQEKRAMLDLAIFFSNPENESWYWIAEELFEQCVDIDIGNKTPLDQQLEAISKHLFATFLLEALHDPTRAKVYVEQSMKLSVGKFWNATEILGKKRDILYFESCLLLHKIFLEMAHERRNYDIEEAIKLCRSSLHWAKQINCKSAEATALMHLVTIYIAAGKLIPVLSHLESYMKLCFEQKDIQGLCEGYLLLATYHEIINQDDLVVADIQHLLKIAEENYIMKMMALAHRKLATFYLMQGKVKEMQQHAIKSYNYYVELNSKLEMEETRCLTGLAQAQEIMSQYLNILLESEHLDIIEFKILMMWKGLRIPFFTNIKLFQPEAETNAQLTDRIEMMKNEDLSVINKARQTEMASTMSISQSRFTLVKQMTNSSQTSRLGRSVINFQKHMRSAIGSGSDTRMSTF